MVHMFIIPPIAMDPADLQGFIISVDRYKIGR